MDCPTCHKPLSSESLLGQTVDRCGDCDGLWLDDTELGLIVRQARPTVDPVRTISCRDGVTCPKCEELLTPFNYAYDSGVFVATCTSCRGAWLESGQLELIVRYRYGSSSTRRFENALVDEMWSYRFPRMLLRSRLLSSAIALGYLLLDIGFNASVASAFSLLLSLLLPMACIWFPDAMGNLKGVSFGLGRPKITHSTPGDFVAIGGWLLLLSPVFVPLITQSVA